MRVKVCWEEEEEEEEEIPNYNFSKVVSGSAELVPPLALSAFVTNIPHPPAATEARWWAL